MANTEDDDLDEFGGLDDEEILAATQTPEDPRPLAKRRRLEGPQPNGGRSRPQTAGYEDYGVHDDDDGDFDPPLHPIARPMLNSRANATLGSRTTAQDTGRLKTKSIRNDYAPKRARQPSIIYKNSAYGIQAWRMQRPGEGSGTNSTGVKNRAEVAQRSSNAMSQPKASAGGRGEESIEEEEDEAAFDPPLFERKAEDDANQYTNVERGEDGSVQPDTHRRAVQTLPDQYDIPQELADIPSDVMESSSLVQDGPIFISSQISDMPSRQRLVAPQNGLRQTTLFGGVSQGSTASQAEKRVNFQKPVKDEPPTHHKLDQEALKTWVYPTNLGKTRDYQFNIVQKGLYHNLLVALPTGLGKTFIAATIMLNWFRWTTEAQIVFVAPTKPLVAQQIDACFGIAGIPKSVTTMMTGNVAPGLRAEEWKTKRVFFMTPQTFINDLKNGCADPKNICCVVVDEAHRATGNYAYVEVVKFIRRFNPSFRVLALTATPGASVEQVQAVIDGLDISRVEIRTEDSIDIRQYVHRRNIEIEVFDPSEEIMEMQDLYSGAVKPVLSILNQHNAYWSKDPLALTPFGLTQARQSWMGSQAGQSASMGVKSMMHAIFTTLSSLAHATVLLNFHGIGPFYQNLAAFRRDVQGGDKGGKYRKQINDSAPFRTLMSRAQAWINDETFLGHPKLEYLQRVVLNHFLDAGEGRGAANGQPPSETRIMVFVHYRDSAEEVARVLSRNSPMIRPHVFVGQAASKGSEGMDQKKQLAVIDKFQRGVYNTLVATSIGEEGLDIGEVDLIVCYDASASPIRMLQRMGRTGRKRQGNIVLLLMRGKEEDSFTKAKDNYEKMQHMITEGSRFVFHHDLSSRIVPRGTNPVVDKRIIEIPLENTQPELPIPKKGRGRVPKRPPKKFHMPDGVKTGFTKASRLPGGIRVDHDASDGEEEEEEDDTNRSPSDIPEHEKAILPPLEDVLLSALEEAELQRMYQNVGGHETQVVPNVRMDAFPTYQRTLGRTNEVGHGRVTKRVVRMLHSMHAVNFTVLQKLEDNLHEDDKTVAENPVAAVDEDDSSDESPRPSQRGARVRPLPAKKTVAKETPAKRKPVEFRRTYKPATPVPTSPSQGEESAPQEWELTARDLYNEYDDDMDGFVVSDGELGVPTGRAARAKAGKKRVRESVKMKRRLVKGKRKVAGVTDEEMLSGDEVVDSDEELPDVGELVQGSARMERRGDGKTGREEKGESEGTDEPPTPSQRGRRRVVVSETDDDDDDEL